VLVDLAGLNAGERLRLVRRRHRLRVELPGGLVVVDEQVLPRLRVVDVDAEVRRRLRELVRVVDVLVRPRHQQAPVRQHRRRARGTGDASLPVGTEGVIDVNVARSSSWLLFPDMARASTLISAPACRVRSRSVPTAMKTFGSSVSVTWTSELAGFVPCCPASA